MSAGTTQVSAFHLFRRVRETGETEDWMVQASDQPPLVVFADKAGARKYRRVVMSGDQIAEGIPEVRERLKGEKERQGYSYLGDADVSEDGRIVRFPERLDVGALWWSMPQGASSQEVIQAHLRSITEVLEGKSWFGVDVEWSDADQGLLLKRRVAGGLSTLYIGTSGPAALFRGNGRASGMLEPGFMPIGTLVLMCLKNRVKVMSFADGNGNEHPLSFHRSNPWLMPDVYPLSVQRRVAADLGLCAPPVDFGACESDGLGF